MKKNKNIQPEVSIAMCTYNGALFLREQLESIINQDYKNITEVVCVDDNSRDDTWQILEEYAQKYPKFKIIQNNSNLGFTKNFEKAFSLTTKPFIAIADQDDIWYSSKITKLIDNIGSNLMSYSDNEYIDINGYSLGKKFSDYRRLSTCTSCLNFTLYNGISGHTAMINRNLLKYAFPFSTVIPYDYWLAFHATQHGVIPYVNEPLVGYRQHETNALGAVGVSKSKKKDSVSRKITHEMILNFITALDERLVYEKQVLQKLAVTYVDLSLKSRIKRVALFWQNKEALLFFKKRNEFRKAFYCLKMLWQIR
ncbi:MAG: glycosyltransferase family 2 protein [Paludibacter sp.]|nr:glycosyltransferase family 2 protein [Paludibacter sp.]